MKYIKGFVVKCKYHTLPFLCSPSRWAPEVKWCPRGQRAPPLSLWRRQRPGPPRPVSPSTASSLTERSPVTRCMCPSTRTTMYFNFSIMWYYCNRCMVRPDMLSVHWLSLGVSRVEQWQSPARCAGIASFVSPWSPVPRRSHGHGDTQWHPAGWPQLESDAGIATLFICQSLEV